MDSKKHHSKHQAENQENEESKQHQALARAFALAQYHDSHRYALKPTGQTKKAKRPPRSFRSRRGGRRTQRVSSGPLVAGKASRRASSGKASRRTKH